MDGETGDPPSDIRDEDEGQVTESAGIPDETQQNPNDQAGTEPNEEQEGNGEAEGSTEPHEEH